MIAAHGVAARNSENVLRIAFDPLKVPPHATAGAREESATNYLFSSSVSLSVEDCKLAQR